MKNIFNFENFNESLNISKIRKFPTYGETHKDDKNIYNKNHSDIYSIYKLNKNELGKYLNTWFVGQVENIKKTDKLGIDEMYTVKKTDKETTSHLYDRKYNPISISIMYGKQNDKGEDLYKMKLHLYSIDDSSYGIWWNETNTIEEYKNIRKELMKYISSVDEINGEKLLDECIKYGADPESKDY